MGEVPYFVQGPELRPVPPQISQDKLGPAEITAKTPSFGGLKITKVMLCELRILFHVVLTYGLHLKVTPSPCCCNYGRRKEKEW